MHHRILTRYFMPGYVFLTGSLDTGEKFLFSPDERIVRIKDMSDIEYLETVRAPSRGGACYRDIHSNISPTRCWRPVILKPVSMLLA